MCSLGLVVLLGLGSVVLRSILGFLFPVTPLVFRLCGWVLLVVGEVGGPIL